MSRKLGAFINTGIGISAAFVVAGVVAFGLAQADQASATAPDKTVSTTSTKAPTARPTAKPTTAQSSSTPVASASHEPAGNPTAVAGGKKVLFLTFDDGPDPVWTPQVLAVLAKYDAHGTFFELGSMQAAHPAIRDQVLAAGNTIGSHSISHAQLTKVSAAKRHHEIFDGPQSKCFRPPYGAVNDKVRADVRAAGMIPVLWDVDTLDWQRPGKQAIVNSILTQARSGSVVLMHDGGGNRSQTVAALDQALETLTAQGYTFPTMDC
ncbi:polysaccharide deacetylase family protein [Streptomyces sp. SID13031]|uniref:polysaccharide deacetylase family protein n=1 Tax=Streptomyces sp. SID13031 TaxID=2706046 RepID=UPI0013C6375C|nr:polysaccharide deacetylase family protein [Streptomyces sp. SID13031]NEA34272.1 polysaccharide deacetylase family protein [Streptomyces sp. SID13031]